MTRRSRRPFDLISRVLAERLRGSAPSDQLSALVCAQDIDWERVVGQASAQFVLPAFAAALRDLNLSASLEPELARFLTAVHEASVGRNMGLYDQLGEIAWALNLIGIEPVLLKGAIRLVDGLYPDLGWRLMIDLDILVAEADFMRAVAALQGTGYVGVRAADPTHKDVKLRRGRLNTIEIHRELFWTTRKQQVLRGAEVIAGSRPAAVNGARVRLPSAEHQVAHLVGHSQIGHFNHIYGRIALRERLEAAAMLRWTPGEIDWNAVHARFAAAGYHRPLLAFLVSLRDGGLCAEPCDRADALTALQVRRIALQARFPAMTRLSLLVGWYIVLFKLQILERDAGQPKVLHSLSKLLLHGEERRRVAEIFARGGPSPW